MATNNGFRYNDRFNHSAWLTFMRSRLEVAKELLRRDGTIFVSLDDGEAHYCKVLMDEVFGRDKFVANFVWQKRYAPDARIAVSDAHEHVLCYAINPAIFAECRNLLPLTDAQTKQFSNRDNDERGPWKADNFTAAGYRPNQMYEITLPSGRVVTPPPGRCWRVTIEGFRKFEAQEMMYYGPDGDGAPSVKRFLADMEGMVPWTWWAHTEAGHSQEGKKESYALFGGDAAFDTPKPERLLHRIIHIATDPGDLVLDFFSGSGTTPSVAQKMGRKWVAVEQMDYVLDIPGSRLKKVIEGEQGGISKAVDWQGGGSFIYAELAASNSIFVDRIGKAQDIATLQAIYADIQATGYLRYDVDLSAFDVERFGALRLDDAKRVLVDCLDVNHLYVNLGSLDDAGFNISDEDAAATRSFYGIAP